MSEMFFFLKAEAIEEHDHVCDTRVILKRHPNKTATTEMNQVDVIKLTLELAI